MEPLRSFELSKSPEQWYEVNILGEGKAALEKVNDHLGKSSRSKLEFLDGLLISTLKVALAIRLGLGSPD